MFLHSGYLRSFALFLLSLYSDIRLLFSYSISVSLKSHSLYHVEVPDWKQCHKQHNKNETEVQICPVWPFPLCDCCCTFCIFAHSSCCASQLVHHFASSCVTFRQVAPKRPPPPPLVSTPRPRVYLWWNPCLLSLAFFLNCRWRRPANFLSKLHHSSQVVPVFTSSVRVR